MKKLLTPPLLFITTLLCLAACTKEEKEDKPIVVPTIVMDKVIIEQNLVGTWKGIIRGSGGATENVEVTIEKMILGSKVAAGKYFTPSFSCGFEWTYESFLNGKVTFREKTMDPNICYDDVAVVAHFENDDFSKLHLSIAIQNLFFSGALSRQ